MCELLSPLVMLCSSVFIVTPDLYLLSLCLCKGYMCAYIKPPALSVCQISILHNIYIQLLTEEYQSVRHTHDVTIMVAIKNT